MTHIYDTQSATNTSRVVISFRRGYGVQCSSNHQQPHPIVVQNDFAPPRQRHYSQEPLQYDQGPQGDPFAPQPPAAYLPIPETELPRVAKTQKRKRKPRREEECGFCQRNDGKNKHGEPEVMVSCEECGRSGASRRAGPRGQIY